MLINLIIYGLVFYVSYSWLTANIKVWLGTDLPDASFWLVSLNIILIILAFILVLFICYLLFIVFGGIITAPFNEEISQRVEEIVTNGSVFHNTGFWTDAFASIKGEVQKLAFYFIILFFLFLLDFIPVIGNAAAIILGLFFSFFYNALEFLDFPLTRRLASFRQKLRVTQKGGMVSFGFGCMAFLMMFLPVVNVFMKPILVVSGTSLYYEKYIL